MFYNEIPFCLRADAYTVGSDAFAGEKARDSSVYNFTNRYSPKDVLPELCRDSRMVLFGVDWFVRKYMRRITIEDVELAEEFMSQAHSFGGGIEFPKEMWESVVHDFGGYLQLKIEALQDGSTFFPNEPVIQVSNTASGFGELTAHIEAEMVGIVSNATARLTVARHLYERVLEWLAEENVPEEQREGIARFMIHDFGYRASSTPEESALFGYVHLLVFNGTDTFNAAWLAKRDGAEHPIGTSIQALAHRNVLGHESEPDCFFHLLNASQKCTVPIASYVSDCYNFGNALGLLSGMAEAYPKSIFVCRPDSGDYIECVLDVCRKNQKNLRFLQGDGMDIKKMSDVVNCMHEEGYKISEKGIFGVGGWLRNICTRDLFSSAYKISSIGQNEPVCKLSEVKTKMSIPGPNVITRSYPNEACVTANEYATVHFANADLRSEYVTVYNNGRIQKKPNFMDMRKRVHEDFYDCSRYIGCEKLLHSVPIREFQKKIYSEYRS